MKIKRSYLLRMVILVSAMVTLAMLSTRMEADTGTCNGSTLAVPFTDVQASIFFCQIAEAYFSGLTNGTTPTTYSPSGNVTRDQMAAFITRTMEQSLKRGSERAVTKKWWTPQTANGVTLTTVGVSPRQVEFDGIDVWVANGGSGSVMRVRASDGKILDTWTGATNATGVLAAMGKIFVTAETSPGHVYVINPDQPAGAVTTLSSSVGSDPLGITFDGSRIWTANNGHSVSMISLNPTTVTTVSNGFMGPVGIIYDGANIWITDEDADTLLKLDSSGAIVQTISVGDAPLWPVFDGTNIWVPNSLANSVTVVRVKDLSGNPLTTAPVIATLTGNGLNFPNVVAFDGERILAANRHGNSVSLWKAADLTALGSVSIGSGTSPVGACSDGLNFWISCLGNVLARF